MEDLMEEPTVFAVMQAGWKNDIGIRCCACHRVLCVCWRVIVGLYYLIHAHLEYPGA